MERVCVKSPAKLNLTLEITGADGGFHLLDSVVVTIDLFDVITVNRRTDGRVTVAMRGMGSEDIPQKANNAARAASLFVERFSTYGADIFIEKNIPVGAGLGGSSADAAGVLNALSKLYGIGGEAVGEIADSVGSDARYQMSGGWARMGGRGNLVAPIHSAMSLNFLVIAPHSGVMTAECYKKYDELPAGARGSSEAAQAALMRGDYAALCKSFYNALYAPASLINSEVGTALSEALALSPDGAAMTGSGSAVFAAFKSRELCLAAQSSYRGSFRTFCVQTYLPRTK